MKNLMNELFEKCDFWYKETVYREKFPGRYSKEEKYRAYATFEEIYDIIRRADLEVEFHEFQRKDD